MCQGNATLISEEIKPEAVVIMSYACLKALVVSKYTSLSDSIEFC